MPVIIDGNNLLHSLPSHERNRDNVRRRALDTVRHEQIRLTVVFDGPPPAGSSNPESLGPLTIRYSGASSADDLILRLIPLSGASEWVVVTDDRALRDRVHERGGQVRSLNEWRSRRSRERHRQSWEPKLSSRDVADWEAYFSAGGDTEDS